MDPVVTGTGIAAAGVDTPLDLLRENVGPDPDYDPAALLGRRGLRYKDQATRLALLAARNALGDAGLFDEAGAVTGSEAFAVVVSSNTGNLDTVCRTVETIRAEGVGGTSPMDLPNASSNVIASSVAIKYSLRGPNLMLCNGEASGLDAVHWASVLIRAGRVARVLVIGVEAANTVTHKLAGDQFEGAAALVVESAESARSRGATEMAAVGRYARRARPDASVREVLDAAPVSVGLALAGARPAGSAPSTARAHDLDSVLGPSSGARGVLQCVAGAGWLTQGNDGDVLAAAGSDADGSAALLLHAAGAAR